MTRKRYTARGLVREAQERTRRLENARVEREREEMRALGTRYACDCCGFTIRTVETLDECPRCASYIAHGIAQLEAMLTKPNREEPHR